MNSGTQRHLPQDHGSSMVIVISYISLLMLFVIILTTGTHNLLSRTRHSQNFHSVNEGLNGAIEDYLSRINTAPIGNYFKYANIGATECPGMAPIGGSIDPTNPFMGSELNSLPGKATDIKINYFVDQSQACLNGNIFVTATAQSHDLMKQVIYTIRRKSFTDFAYFTDYEDLSPRYYKDVNRFGPGVSINDVCERHYYEPSRTGLPANRPEAALNQNPGCSSINWVSNDEVSGPLHTNDALIICGVPYFRGKTSTSWEGDGTKHYLLNPSSECNNDPQFMLNRYHKYCGEANDACYEPPMQMPVTTLDLSSVQDSCVYYGPTKINMWKAGFMDITSPNTPYSAKCGPGYNIPVPLSGVVYVKNVPALNPPKTPVPCTIPTGGTSPQNPLGYPVMDAAGQDITPYGCTDGDIFLSGEARSNLTIAAENRLILVSSIYSPGGSLLGLVGGQGVEIYHPVTASGKNILPTSSKVEGIYAAILTINDSFSIQNFDVGAPLGQLYVQGSIAQRWRGIMGTTDLQHGYNKVYHWDSRYRYNSPPYFLTPTNTNYTVYRTEIVRTQTMKK